MDTAELPTGIRRHVLDAGAESDPEGPAPEADPIIDPEAYGGGEPSPANDPAVPSTPSTPSTPSAPSASSGPSAPSGPPAPAPWPGAPAPQPGAAPDGSAHLGPPAPYPYEAQAPEPPYGVQAPEPPRPSPGDPFATTVINAEEEEQA